MVSHAADLTGAPKLAREIVRSLGDDWDRVVVLRRRGEREQELRESSERLAIEPLHRLCRFLRHWAWTRPLEAVLAQLIGFFELLRFRPDLVYLNTSESAGYVRPALWLGRRVVLHVHEPRDDAAKRLRPHRLGRLFGAITLVAVSRAAQHELSQLTGVPQGHIQLVRTSIDPVAIAVRRTPPRLGPPTIGTVGSMTHRKGVDLWVEVARLVIRALPDARFVWLGDEPPTPVRNRVRSLGLDDQLEFRPATPDPISAMSEFTLLALPSRAETAAMVVQEAMALGLPVVSFDLPPVAEQLGDTGRLVVPEDVTAMAAAVVDLVAHPDERRAMGERARARALEEFSLDRFRDDVRRIASGA